MQHLYMGNGQVVAQKNGLSVVVERDGDKWFARVYAWQEIVQERAEANEQIAAHTADRYVDFLRARKWVMPTR